MYPLTAIELISGMSVVMCTRIVIIGLIIIIYGVPTTLVFIVASLELLLKFLPVKNPPNPRLKFIANPNNYSPSSNIHARHNNFSTLMVVMTALND